MESQNLKWKEKAPFFAFLIWEEWEVESGFEAYYVFGAMLFSLSQNTLFLEYPTRTCSYFCEV